MAYLGNDSGGTADDRRSEADRILKMLDKPIRERDDLSSREIEFLDRMFGNRNQPISTKQLFWLRDIKDKYL